MVGWIAGDGEWDGFFLLLFACLFLGEMRKGTIFEMFFFLLDVACLRQGFSI